MQEELNTLAIEENNEVNKILYILSGLVMDCETQLRCNMETMVTLDVIFARAKLSASMEAIPATHNTKKHIKIVNGRHPLLARSKCVPLNFEFQPGINGIVITGPNTGGKTVALKTIGLFAMMAQSGLHLPCEEADICLTNAILCDIGDGQSITENLSTFSSHISNIIEILQLADYESLVLLDELGSGTDPQEGMGIAIAILEELKEKQCLFVATTHYPEIKEFAATTPGIMNARMAFDRESMSPRYQLEIGEAGESCALYIATRLGLPDKLIQRAKKAVGQSLKASYHSILTEDSKVDENRKTSMDKEVEQVQVGQIKTENEPDIKLSRIEKAKEIKLKEVPTRAVRFEIGDSVMVYPQKKIGLIFEKTNLKGDIGVQIAGKKEYVNYKRLQLKASAKEMYPEDYDFSIVFDTVANRKARHKMDKGYVGVQTSVEAVKRAKN
jgi:dsDNA-specific endonuclease/ATPase MutS2